MFYFMVEMPMTEKLAFTLTTLLCDLAVTLDEEERCEIVSVQLESLQRLSDGITQSVKMPHADQHQKGLIILLHSRYGVYYLSYGTN